MDPPRPASSRTPEEQQHPHDEHRVADGDHGRFDRPGPARRRNGDGVVGRRRARRRSAADIAPARPDDGSAHEGRTTQTAARAANPARARCSSCRIVRSDLAGRRARAPPVVVLRVQCSDVDQVDRRRSCPTSTPTTMRTGRVPNSLSRPYPIAPHTAMPAMIVESAVHASPIAAATSGIPPNAEAAHDAGDSFRRLPEVSNRRRACARCRSASRWIGPPRPPALDRSPLTL